MTSRLTLALVACVVAACAAVGGTGHTSSPPSAEEPVRSERRLAQSGRERLAHFGECAPAGCPPRTPKTLVASLDAPSPATVPDSSQAASPPPAPSAADLPRSIPSLDSPGKRITLIFAFGRSTLTATHKAQLRAVLADLRRSSRIVVAGRTDDLGSEAFNQALALARGLAVRDYLLDLDLQLPARIAIDARGRCCYAAPNDDEQSRSRNRRVELAYAGDAGDLP